MYFYDVLDYTQVMYFRFRCVHVIFEKTKPSYFCVITKLPLKRYGTWFHNRGPN